MAAQGFGATGTDSVVTCLRARSDGIDRAAEGLRTDICLPFAPVAAMPFVTGVPPLVGACYWLHDSCV